MRSVGSAAALALPARALGRGGSTLIGDGSVLRLMARFCITSSAEMVFRYHNRTLRCRPPPHERAALPLRAARHAGRRRLLASTCAVRRRRSRWWRSCAASMRTATTGRPLVVHHDRSDSCPRSTRVGERGWRANPSRASGRSAPAAAAMVEPCSRSALRWRGSFSSGATGRLLAGLGAVPLFRCRDAVPSAARLLLLITADARSGWHGGGWAGCWRRCTSSPWARCWPAPSAPACNCLPVCASWLLAAPAGAAVVVLRARRGPAGVRHGHGAGRLAAAGAAMVITALLPSPCCGPEPAARGMAGVVLHGWGAQAALALLLISAAALVASDRPPAAGPRQRPRPAPGGWRLPASWGCSLRFVPRTAADVHARLRYPTSAAGDRRRRGAARVALAARGATAARLRAATARRGLAGRRSRVVVAPAASCARYYSQRDAP